MGGAQPLLPLALPVVTLGAALPPMTEVVNPAASLRSRLDQGDADWQVVGRRDRQRKQKGRVRDKGRNERQQSFKSFLAGSSEGFRIRLRCWNTRSTY